MKRLVRNMLGIWVVLLAGAGAQAELKLVVNFDSLTGTPDGQACNGVLGGFLDTESEGTGNSSLATVSGSVTMSVIGHSSGTLARAVGVGGINNTIDNGETGIGFFRLMMATGGTVRSHMGLISDTTDNPVNATNTGDPKTIPAGFRLVDNGTGFDLLTTDGATVLKPGLARSQWYNVWIVADNAADTFDLYLSTAAGPAGAATLPNPEDLVKSGIPFGVATTGPMNGMIFANPISPTGSGQATRIYVDEIWWDGDQGLSKPNKARNPSPADKATDVLRDVVLGWTPGQYAAKHDVYFGTSFADVNAASRTSPGSVLVSQNQDANNYDPTGLLQLGRTYYWRIDEVNAPPTSTVFKGAVWSFTTEPVTYQIKNIIATASSFHNAGTGPEKTVDGSGLNTNDQHGTLDTTMWLSSGTATGPAWIQYQFDRVYKLQEMWVWNANQSVEPFVGFGFKSVTIQYSTDGTNWTQLAGVADFAQATGLTDYVHNTTVNFAGIAAKYVKITANSNYGVLKQYGLSEVRFFQTPVQAREPNPTSGQTGVALDATLRWRAGREAATHKLYISTTKKAVREGTVAPVSITATGSQASYGPLSLELGKMYFWRVDEVNEAATPSTWQGDIWSFATQSYLVVDDFEDYNNSSPKRVFQTWIDGLGFSAPAPGSPGNGSSATVGHDIWTAGTPYTNIMETTIIHGGKQSMPVDYNNAKSPFYSETDRTWTTGQDWTRLGIKSLTLWFRGNPPAFLETTGGVIYASGVGTDIWGTADQGRFVYKQLTGNGTIIARVDSLSNTNAWAKAGVMIRETLDAGSTWAFGLCSISNGVHFQARLTTGVSAVSDTSITLPAAQTAVQAPVWIKLERIGNQFNVYYATDAAGTNWTAIPWNPQTINMTATNVFIGLAVTSHQAGVVCGAKFSNISTTGNVTGQWQSADLGIPQPTGGNKPESLCVTLDDGTTAGKKTLTHPDPNVTVLSDWQEWNIPLSQFTGVNLKNVKKMYIGAGNKASPKAGGAGTLYIDDIRLYPARCLPAVLKPAGDVTSDCAVDYADIDILANQWLQTVTPPATLSGDLTTDSKVDLKDFSKMAQGWLEQFLWP